MKIISILLLSSFIINLNVFSQKLRPVEEAKGLEIGIQAPLFEAVNQHGEKVSLQEEMKKGPVILLFFRGEWCPVCNRYLSNLQDSLNYLTEKGAIVLAVGPQKQEYLKKSGQKSGAEFILLYDEGYRIMDAYDVTFVPTGKEIFTYNTILKTDLKKSQSDTSQVLPVPATYIINQEGKIIWRHFDHNYKIRATVKEMLDNLPTGAR